MPPRNFRCPPRLDGASLRRGWTTLEFLVALAVAAILFVILAMGAAPLKRATAAARCAHNLRQIGAGLSLYMQENRVFPYYIDGNTRWFDGSADPKSFFAGPYLKAVPRSQRFAGGKSPSARGGLFDCPAIAKADKEGLGPQEWIEDFFDYGLNLSLCGRPPAAIASPSRTVAVAEGGNYARVKAQHTKGLTYTPTETSNPGGTAWNWAATNGGTPPILYTKNNRASFLFLDGHVGLHRASELAEGWFDGK